jgi:hypothetical protein
MEWEEEKKEMDWEQVKKEEIEQEKKGKGDGVRSEGERENGVLR